MSWEKERRAVLPERPFVPQQSEQKRTWLSCARSRVGGGGGALATNKITQKNSRSAYGCLWQQTPRPLLAPLIQSDLMSRAITIHRHTAAAAAAAASNIRVDFADKSPSLFLSLEKKGRKERRDSLQFNWLLSCLFLFSLPHPSFVSTRSRRIDSSATIEYDARKNDRSGTNPTTHKKLNTTKL